MDVVAVIVWVVLVVVELLLEITGGVIIVTMTVTAMPVTVMRSAYSQHGTPLS